MRRRHTTGCSSCLGHLWRRAAEPREAGPILGDSVGSFGLPRAGGLDGQGGGSSSSRRRWAEAPDGCGLTVKLDAEGVCRMSFTPDTGVPGIHPNIHVPVALRGLRELGGGGSGVTVVAGYDPVLGPVVFKHGGERDTAEFFALATIEEQLRQRGRTNDAAEAARYMWERTPDFKFLYMSRVHLKNRGAQLWGDVKNKLKRQIAGKRGKKISQVLRSSVMMRLKGREDAEATPRSTSSRSTDAGDKPIRLCKQAAGGDECEVVSFVDERLQVVLETEEDVWTDLMEQEDVRCCKPGGDRSYIQRFGMQLVELQRKHQWKFTLAQKAIGGPSAVTCCKLLVRGQLRDELLRKLISEYLAVIEHLRRLTLPQERSFHEEAQREFDQARDGDAPAPAVLSPACDTYFGFAVNKNFDPAKGRFRKLRDIGQVFRSGQLEGKQLVLMDGEDVPAQLLGRILDRGAQMEDTFAEGVHGPTALDIHGDSWLDFMEDALHLSSPAAQERIWTCGVSDGGLHNLFLEDNRLWLFDMGEPALMSLPGFLTKFLFSFFHTLGMEEPRTPTVDPKKFARQSSPGERVEWVNRFSYDEGPRAELTSATVGLVATAEAALDETLQGLVAEVFKGEQEVVGVLIRYVILQLLSDAAFCLEKWQTKGGGVTRPVDRGGSLEKWLWRALWDMYAAGYVACREWSGTDQTATCSRLVTRRPTWPPAGAVRPQPKLPRTTTTTPPRSACEAAAEAPAEGGGAVPLASARTGAVPLASSRTVDLERRHVWI